MAYKKLPSVDELKNAFAYDADTGIITWKVSRGGKAIKGARAGGLKGDGYRRIDCGGATYFEHRVVWALYYGDYPTLDIDHINGDRTDNRIANLRLVTMRQNQQNLKWHRKGRLVGASYNKEMKKWKSQISINGETKHIGYYPSEQSAHEAYVRVAEARAALERKEGE